MMNKIKYLLILIFGSSFLFLQAQPASTFKIVNRIHLEGDEKWDYLFSDDMASRLYVSHGKMVQIIDESKGEVVGKITDFDGVHGIAIAPVYIKALSPQKMTIPLLYLIQKLWQ